MNTPFHILFICTGNICRSPMAEYLLRQKLKQTFSPPVTIESAGIMGLDAQPVPDEILQLMRERDIDISAHRSKQVTDAMLKDADLVFALAMNHYQDLKTRRALGADVLHLLANFPSSAAPQPDQSIIDPFGGTITLYQTILNQIDAELDRIFPDLQRLILETYKK